jgi:cadherin 15 (M-cadherin)
VDEEPRNVFSIDKFTGRVYLNATLDREKTDRFRVGPVGSQTAQLLFPT